MTRSDVERAPAEPAEPEDGGPPTAERARGFGPIVLLARRQRWGLLLGVAVLCLAVGVAVGRGTAPGPEADARRAVEVSVLPLALDADGIWTSTTDDRDAVSEGLVQLRRDGDPRLVERNLDAWLEAYDAALVRLAGVDLPPSARPVQRQFISAVTLSRDAVEVLGHASTVEDETVRRDLTTEVGRLRTRSEQLIQSARASTSDLDGSRTDVSPLPSLRTFLEGRHQ
jgi:hypothetical protein